MLLLSLTMMRYKDLPVPSTALLESVWVIKMFQTETLDIFKILILIPWLISISNQAFKLLLTNI